MRRDDWFTEAELRAIESVLDPDSKDPLLFRMGLETAAKASGMCNLKLSDLRFDIGMAAVIVREQSSPRRMVRLSKDFSKTLWDLYYSDFDRWRSTNVKYHRGPRQPDYFLFKTGYHRRDPKEKWFYVKSSPISTRTLNRRVQGWASRADIRRYVHWGTVKNSVVIRRMKKGESFKEIAGALQLNERSLHLAYRKYAPTPQELEDSIEYRI